jgi:DNA-binding response OmpR family regulator
MPQTILIVDDEANIIIPLEFLMRQEGYNVIVAQSGEEAFEMIAKYVPDLVLLDIMLPVINGFEVCEIVRLNPDWEKMKVMFLSARRRDLDVAKGLMMGADDYITKPFSNTNLVRKVNSLLSCCD